MPHIVNRPKKIQKKHILNFPFKKSYAEGASKAELNDLDNTIKKTYVPKIILKLLNHINAAIRRHKRNLRASSSFLLGTTLMSPENWYTLSFSDEHLQTAYYDHDNYRYYSQKAGAYHIDVFVIWQYVNWFDVTRAKLAIYRNGSPYKLLDYKATPNYIVDDYNLTMQGSCLTYLNCGDYIEVKFWYDGVLSLAPTNILLEYGYFDIHFAGCNSSEITTPNLGWELNTII